MIVNSTSPTNLKCLFLTSICLLFGLIYYVIMEPKWTEKIQVPPVKIAEEKNLVNDYQKDGIIEDNYSSIEYYGGWKIINDERALRAEVETIHSSNYKVRDGDQCKKSIPDFILVGVAKCGTRELIDLMSIHPNIVTKSFPYKLSPSEKILNKMPCKYHDQLSGFKMDSGLGSISAPERIYALNPNMKIMAIVREPLSRMISGLTFVPSANTHKNVITHSSAMKSYMQMLINNTLHKNEPDRLVKQSSYDVGLKRYLKYFKRDQILVIESSEFTKDPVSVLRTVEKFLGIASFVSYQYLALNSKKNFYCIRKINTSLKTMVCYQSNRGRKQNLEVDDEDKEVFRNYFRPHNENLYRLIGRRFDW